MDRDWGDVQGVGSCQGKGWWIGRLWRDERILQGEVQWDKIGWIDWKNDGSNG
jgi:hypothetical protein